MPRVYSDEERAAWMHTLPAKRIGGVLMIYNSKGQVLLQKPSYRKNVWQVPGGVVEESETPLTGAVREIKEELGLDIPKEDVKFEGIFHIPAHGAYPDFLNTVFSTQLNDEQVKSIDFRKEEIEDIMFVDLEEMENYMPPFIANGYKDVLEVSTAAYSEGQGEIVH